MNDIINRISQGNPYALYGERRAGKTTYALEIKAILEKEGY